MQPSKKVNDLIKLNGSISALKGWGPQAAAGVEARLGAAAAAGVVPMFDGSIGRLDGKTGTVRTLDIRLAQEVSDDSGPLRRRDERKDALREMVIGIKGAAEHNLGEEALDDLGMTGSTPSDPTLLATYTEQLIGTLTSPDLVLPEPKPWGAAVSPADWAELLRPGLAELKAELAAVDDERREVNDVRAARDAAVDEWLAEYRSCAGLLSELLSFAGLQDLADRVRPTTRRSRGIDPAPEVPAPPQEA